MNNVELNEKKLCGFCKLLQGTHRRCEKCEKLLHGFQKKDYRCGCGAFHTKVGKDKRYCEECL